jgi:gamma-glutamylputrescine oxidase
LTERALERMAALAGDAFRPVGSLRLANDADEAVALQAEYEALREDGFAAEWQEDLGGRLAGRFAGALFHPTDGSIHPARWVRRLAARAAEAGAEICEHDQVEGLDELDAEQVVVATDGYTHGLLDELDRAIRPTRGQVVVTAPLDEELYRCPHYARYGYEYWQQTPDLRLVLGGFRDTALDEEWTAREEMTAGIQARLETYVEELAGGPVEITRRWCGIFGVTADLLPVVGRVRDGVWAACGYSGHGNVLGLACGDLVGRAIADGPSPELSLFDAAPTPSSRD